MPFARVAGVAHVLLVFLLVGASPSSAAPAPATTTPDTTPLRPLFSANPAYPIELNEFAVEGRVTLDCAITPDGVPEDCAVTKSSDHRFDRSALQAEAAARYMPATRNGQPRRVSHHVINISYAMPREPFRTNVMLTCRITPAGHATDCTTTRITGSAAIAKFAQSVAERAVYDPSRDKGVPVTDPARTIILAVLTMRILQEKDLSLPDLSDNDARIRFFVACKLWPAKSCQPVNRDEAKRLLHSRPDPVHPDLYAFEIGIVGADPDPG